MFDFHLHTYHSDGLLNVVDLLKLAEASGLNTFLLLIIIPLMLMNQILKIGDFDKK